MRRHKFDPDYVVPTAEVLREWLDDLHLSTAVAAVKAGKERKQEVVKVVERVLADGEVHTYEATVLALVTGISVDFWQSFEHNYRTGLAAGKKRVE